MVKRKGTQKSGDNSEMDTIHLSIHYNSDFRNMNFFDSEIVYSHITEVTLLGLAT